MCEAVFILIWSKLVNPGDKGPVEANAAGENSSFILTVCVKSVPLSYFKLACVVQHITFKQFFGTRF